MVNSRRSARLRPPASYHNFRVCSCGRPIGCSLRRTRASCCARAQPAARLHCVDPYMDAGPPPEGPRPRRGTRGGSNRRTAGLCDSSNPTSCQNPVRRQRFCSAKGRVRPEQSIHCADCEHRLVRCSDLDRSRDHPPGPLRPRPAHPRPDRATSCSGRSVA